MNVSKVLDSCPCDFDIYHGFMSFDLHCSLIYPSFNFKKMGTRKLLLVKVIFCDHLIMY